MIEVLKQALDALGPNAPECCGCKAEWEIAIESLRQAIAAMESQKPVAWADMGTRDVDNDAGLSWTTGHFHTTPLYTTPPAAQPQRKPLTDGDFLDWYDSAIWGNEDFKQCCQIAFEAGWQFAHGIKGEA